MLSAIESTLLSGWRIACDMCERAFTTRVISAASAARTHAVENGWLVSADGALCPSCAAVSEHIASRVANPARRPRTMVG
ncbi:hypothetical protein GOEFS_106_00620 [Gordonia effusa NBRC 100432]|uniref:Uncharacterized protein n=1 Tax=Gordonia effusa NBRC 100432 TaxID=1077974 RepID=H0R515_9ACTN|nr:hypothetical protein [Gordonia effusa]GAB20166.1 hypothetical protein GOEFS_106_00620 [Gordonia effusa NBRC 100432]